MIQINPFFPLYVYDTPLNIIQNLEVLYRLIRIPCYKMVRITYVFNVIDIIFVTQNSVHTVYNSCAPTKKCIIYIYFDDIILKKTLSAQVIRIYQSSFSIFVHFSLGAMSNLIYLPVPLHENRFSRDSNNIIKLLVHVYVLEYYIYYNNYLKT